MDSYLELLKDMPPTSRYVENKFPIRENILVHGRPFFLIIPEDKS